MAVADSQYRCTNPDFPDYEERQVNCRTQSYSCGSGSGRHTCFRTVCDTERWCQNSSEVHGPGLERYRDGKMYENSKIALLIFVGVFGAGMLEAPAKWLYKKGATCVREGCNTARDETARLSSLERLKARCADETHLSGLESEAI